MLQFSSCVVFKEKSDHPFSDVAIVTANGPIFMELRSYIYWLTASHSNMGFTYKKGFGDLIALYAIQKFPQISFPIFYLFYNIAFKP